MFCCLIRPDDLGRRRCGVTCMCLCLGEVANAYYRGRVWGVHVNLQPNSRILDGWAEHEVTENLFHAVTMNLMFFAPVAFTVR
jgi:hypothetical protein